METLEGGAKPGNLSLESPASSYYEALYSTRLKWSKHAIPVRVKYKGLFIESYIYTVGKVGMFEDRKAHCKVAYIGDKVLPTVELNYKDIYPSKRRFKKLGDNQIIDAVILDYPSPELSEFDVCSLNQLSVILPGLDFTMEELKNLLNCDTIPEDLLEPVGIKSCLITATNASAFRVKTKMIASTLRESLIDIEQEYTSCVKCRLGCSRAERNTKIVFGRGNPTSKVLIIGEAPGKMEEETGVVLHPDAPAGGLLRRIMTKVGINQEDCYLTNATLCRPIADEEMGGKQNVKPQSEEMKACLPRLKRVLRSVSPKLVILLGGSAYETWFGHLAPGGVLKNLGDKTKLDDSGNVINYLTYVVPHPSYVVRAEGKPEGAEIKKAYLEHWRAIKAIIDTL